MKILIIGSGAREHALAKALARSPQTPDIFCCGTTYNPGIQDLCTDYWVGDICDLEEVSATALGWSVELAIIGPEAPLACGLADALEAQGIAVVGPKQALARIEASKAFARDLLKKYNIPGLPGYRVFHEMRGVDAYLAELGLNNYVIKANGLAAGKGVKVGGEHLHTLVEAYQYCDELFKADGHFVIEEKLVGQEFSLLCFSDGKTAVSMPAIQDHKRAFVGNKGPNTGGMGSYTDSDHSLPFLSDQDLEQAIHINELTLQALKTECHLPYIGILYGGFMVTKKGVYVIEFNARFGDPEALNVLAILESDFVAICKAMVEGKLSAKMVKFAALATVCKYVVPQGYPEKPVKNAVVDISAVENPDQLYIAALNKMDSKLYTTTSRAAAVVGIAANLFQAENLAETEILRIEGNLMHRSDIGTASLINSSIQQMRELREVDEEDKKLRIAILGSTKGTDMLALIGAAKAGRLNASIELVISDREEAIILERARAHDLKHVFINPKGQSHADFEQKLSDALDEQRIQLVVLIGYMKILSKSFVEQWQNQIINIHPSLLPAFGGSMDRNVHQLVLDAKVPETGCTVHYVTEQVDAGPIILQKTCSVLSDDTVESLKERVQALEGQALVEAINLIALSELSLTTELQYEPSRA